MPTAAYTSLDGFRQTVDGLIKDPLDISATVLSMMSGQFIADAVLRQGGITESGAVRYWESAPLYADDTPEIRAEFAEVPIVPTSVGTPRVVFAHERAMGILVSDEMRRRRIVDPVNQQMAQVSNTMIWSWNQAFFNAVVSNPAVQTLAVANSWASSNATIRADMANAMSLIETAQLQSSLSGFQQQFNYVADTMIIGYGTKNTLIQSSSFAAPYVGDLASESLQYVGKLPSQLMSLDTLLTHQMPAGTAMILQRNRCGFIADELPMQATALYREESRKSLRSDVQRASAVGISDPLSIVVLTGI